MNRFKVSTLIFATSLFAVEGAYAFKCSLLDSPQVCYDNCKAKKITGGDTDNDGAPDHKLHCEQRANCVAFKEARMAAKAAGQTAFSWEAKDYNGTGVLRVSNVQIGGESSNPNDINFPGGATLVFTGAKCSDFGYKP